MERWLEFTVEELRALGHALAVADNEGQLDADGEDLRDEIRRALYAREAL